MTSSTALPRLRRRAGDGRGPVPRLPSTRQLLSPEQRGRLGERREQAVELARRVRAAQPLTSSGVVLLVIGAAAWVAGRALGWEELLVVAAGALVALLLAVPFVVGTLDLATSRTLEPERVMVGDRALAILKVHNHGTKPTPARVVDERIGGERYRLQLDALEPDGRSEAIYPLPTARRGSLQVGPAVIAKADPLGLLRREVSQTPPQTLYVHPRAALLPSLQVGFSRDLEGPTSDSSPAGDVAFHTLRDYQVGDDPRRIHWLSSARVGKLQVRHHVDNRQPWLAVVVDDAASSWAGGDGFERAVEVAASLVLTGRAHHEQIDLHIGTEPLEPGTGHLLDGLCDVGVREGPDQLADGVAIALRASPGASALVLVTSRREPEELVRLVAPARRVERVVVVRCGDGPVEEPVAVPGARVLDVHDLDSLRAGWRILA